MKRFYYLATALLVLAGAAGCKKNADVQEPEQQSSGKMVPFTVTAGQGAQKTSMVEGVLSWTDGDQITVLKQDGTCSTELTLSDGAGSASGTFSGEISADVKDGAALYGMYKATYNAGNFSVNVPTSQTYNATSFQEGIFPSIGTGTYKTDGSTSISLSNPMGILRLRLKGISTVTGLRIASADKSIAGNFNVTSDMTVSGGTENGISMTLPSGGVELNMEETETDLKMFCFVVPPVTFNTNDTVVVNFKDGRTLRKVFSTAVVVEKSRVGTIVICDPCESTIPSMYIQAETLTDQCGQTYKTVKIGDQVWMAENLRCNQYSANSDADASIKSYPISRLTSTSRDYTPYYADATTATKPSCMTDEQMAKLGYLYNWAAAVGVADGQSQIKPFSGNRQGICPNGWHIPSSTEFEALRTKIETTDVKGANKAGIYLKNETGWSPTEGIESLNCYGFTALPAGVASMGSVGGASYHTSFWTAIPAGKDSFGSYAYIRWFGNSEDFLGSRNYLRYNGISVRCLKN